MTMKSRHIGKYVIRMCITIIKSVHRYADAECNHPGYDNGHQPTMWQLTNAYTWAKKWFFFIVNGHLVTITCKTFIPHWSVPQQCLDLYEMSSTIIMYRWMFSVWFPKGTRKHQWRMANCSEMWSLWNTCNYISLFYSFLLSTHLNFTTSFQTPCSHYLGQNTCARKDQMTSHECIPILEYTPV